MKRFTRIMTIALTLAILSIPTGAIHASGSTYDPYNTGYTGYTKPSYYTVGSYYISHQGTIDLAHTLSIYGSSGTILVSAIASVLSTPVIGAPNAFVVFTATSLAINSQAQPEVLTAAAHPGWRVLVTIKDSTVHTSYSTKVTFTAVP